MTLRGLEQAIKKSARLRDKINTVIYADDFIVTGKSKEILEHKVKPAIAAFLKERGLELSYEKTKITHIEEGFDFLGQNVRKYKGKLLIKPTKKWVKGFLKRIRDTIKANKAAPTEHLIRILNPKIQGWANYHRHVVAKKTFNYVDHHIFLALWRWAVRRHPNKGKRWIAKRYFKSHKFRNWVFSVPQINRKRKPYILKLRRAADVPIVRHIKIKADANPFDPAYQDYFLKRERRDKPGLVK